MKKKTLLSLFALVLCVPVAGTLFFLPSFSVAAAFVVDLAAGFRAAADFFRGGGGKVNRGGLRKKKSETKRL